MVAEAAPSSPISRATAVESVLKSKGIHTLDDLEAEEKPKELQLAAHHNLVVLVEMCQAQRPSKLGSLKGSHAKYEDELSRLEQTLQELAGDGTVEVIKWEPGMPAWPGTGSSCAAQPAGGVGAHGRRSRPQSAGAASRSRPQSAGVANSTRLQAMGLYAGSSERLAPRIGAFEVCYKLVNTQSGMQYGPVEIFSKIASGCWPGAPAILLRRVQEQLQGFLQQDLGHGMLFQHAQQLAKADSEERRRPKTNLQQAEDLPDLEPPPAPSAEG